MNQDGNTVPPDEEDQDRIGFVTPPESIGEVSSIKDDDRSPDNNAPPTIVETPTVGDTETPALDSAIAKLKDFEYHFDPIDEQTPETKEEDKSGPSGIQALMMFSPQAVAALPALRTEPWPHTGQKPTPVAIGKATRFLASALEAIDCAAVEAGVHGHAWMVETPDTWNEREDVGTVKVPTKVNTYIGADVTQALQNAHDKEVYRLYHHLVQEGREKLIEWFGKAMFHDMPSSHKPPQPHGKCWTTLPRRTVRRGTTGCVWKQWRKHSMHHIPPGVESKRTS